MTDYNIKLQNVSMADVFDFFGQLEKVKTFDYDQYYYAVRQTWITRKLTDRTSPKSIEVYQITKNARGKITNEFELGKITITQITTEKIELEFDGRLEFVSQPNFDIIFRTFWSGLARDLNQAGLPSSDYPITEMLLPDAREQFRHAWQYNFDDNETDKTGRKFWEKLHELCGKNASIRYMAKKLNVSEDYINRCLGTSQKYIIPGWGGKKKVREKLARLDRKLIS